MTLEKEIRDLQRQFGGFAPEPPRVYRVRGIPRKLANEVRAPDPVGSGVDAGDILTSAVYEK